MICYDTTRSGRRLRFSDSHSGLLVLEWTETAPGRNLSRLYTFDLPEPFVAFGLNVEGVTLNVLELTRQTMRYKVAPTDVATGLRMLPSVRVVESLAEPSEEEEEEEEANVAAESPCSR